MKKKPLSSILHTRKRAILLLLGGLIAGVGIGLFYYTFYITKKQLENPTSPFKYNVKCKEYRFIEKEEIRRLSGLSKEEKIKEIGRIISSKFHNWLENLEERVERGKCIQGIQVRIKTQNCWDNGLPELGKTYLQMYELDREGEYLEKAEGVARFLLRKQTEAGGWGSEAIVAAGDVGEWVYKNLWYLGDDFNYRENKKLNAMRGYDAYLKACLREGPTQNSLIFLMRLNDRLKDKRIDIRIKRGLEFILDSQREDGAWPDWVGYDYEHGNYHIYDSFNDLTTNLCIETLIEAYKRYHDERYLRAIKKAGEFMKNSQIIRKVKDERGEFIQAGWALYYWEGKPMQGRPFEPASICIPATAENILTLLKISKITNDDSYLEIAQRSADFLKRTELTGEYKGMWPYFVEIGTNKGIYPLKTKEGYKLTYDIENGFKDTGYGFLIRGDYALIIPKIIYIWEKERGLPLTYPDYEERKREEILRRVNKVIEEIERGETWGENRKFPQPTIPGKHTYYMRAFRDYLALKQNKYNLRWRE